jgi:hypothetical protein
VELCKSAHPPASRSPYTCQYRKLCINLCVPAEASGVLHSFHRNFHRRQSEIFLLSQAAMLLAENLDYGERLALDAICGRRLPALTSNPYTACVLRACPSRYPDWATLLTHSASSAAPSAVIPCVCTRAFRGLAPHLRQSPLDCLKRSLALRIAFLSASLHCGSWQKIALNLARTMTAPGIRRPQCTQKRIPSAG